MAILLVTSVKMFEPLILATFSPPPLHTPSQELDPRTPHSPQNNFLPPPLFLTWGPTLNNINIFVQIFNNFGPQVLV